MHPSNGFIIAIVFAMSLSVFAIPHPSCTSDSQCPGQKCCPMRGVSFETFRMVPSLTETQRVEGFVGQQICAPGSEIVVSLAIDIVYRTSTVPCRRKQPNPMRVNTFMYCFQNLKASLKTKQLVDPEFLRLV